MKNLDLIEDEYKIAFDDLVERYRKELKDSKVKSRARDNFSKNFKIILDKRNKEYSNYIKKNPDKLLGMPEKKKKVEKEMGIYRAYNLDFNPTFKERFMEWFRKFLFKVKLVFRSIKYNIIPSWLKLFFFRVGLFFKSLFFDIGNIKRHIGRRINFFVNKYMGRMKERVMVVVNWFKEKWTRYEEWKKKKAEEREKRKLEAEEAKRKLEDEKKKAEEAQKEQESDEAGEDCEEGSDEKVDNPEGEEDNNEKSEEKEADDSEEKETNSKDNKGQN